MLKPTHRHLASLALLSAAGLFLEITLTRLLSTLHFPPYVFAVLSLAVLGIGLGAAAATWRARLRRHTHLPVYLASAGVSTLVLTVFAVQTASTDLQLPLLVLVVAPYIFIGLALVTFFSNAHEASPLLYLADLVGGGIGALAAIPILDLLGGINALLFAAAAFGLAGLIVHAPRLRTVRAALTAVSLLFLVANIQTSWLDLDMAALASEKPISSSLSRGGHILRTEWDSFARTDVVAPNDGGPLRLYMDGAAASVMPPAGSSGFLLRDIGFLPFATAQPRRVFIVGPGGGLDVWFGLQVEAEKIVAVEVNPASVQLVEEFSDYNGDLYDHPFVRVEVDEGRSLLRREGEEYDLIFLSQVVTLATERSGFALTENTIYTVDAFQDYLAHLDEDGQIAVKLYDEITLTRALSTALATFRDQGLNDAQALRHTAAFLDPGSNPPIPLLLVRESPYTPEESLELGRAAQRIGFVPLYLPDLWAQPPLDAVQAGTLSFTEIVTRSETDISPTTDDRPFFYQFERGIPSGLQPLLIGLAGAVLLGGGALAVLLRGDRARSLRWAPLYFAGLGVGFMAIEVAVIQQTRLFLGHPTLAITTVLAVLLIGGGLGSGLVGRWQLSQESSLPAWPALAVSAATLVWLGAWPLISRGFLAHTTPVRTLVVIGSLLPLALPMGMPFPLGLRAVGAVDEKHVAAAWAVNGVMTVVGSAGAVTIAIVAGFSRVLLVGVLAYALAAGVAWLKLQPTSSR